MTQCNQLRAILSDRIETEESHSRCCRCGVTESILQNHRGHQDKDNTFSPLEEKLIKIDIDEKNSMSLCGPCVWLYQHWAIKMDQMEDHFRGLRHHRRR